MSKQNVLFLLAFLPMFSFGQISDTINQHQLAGVWQVKTTKTGDALLEHYQFYVNGAFVYNFNQYDDARRVLSLNGHYRLAGHELYMSVQSRVEVTGGYFTKGSPGFQSSPFVIEGGNIETFKQVDTTNQHDPFFITVSQRSKTGKIISIEIDHTKYYRISDNPNAFSRNTTLKQEN